MTQPGAQPPDETSHLSPPLPSRGADLWQIHGHVERPARSVPVVHEVDVVVAGGGVAGIIAAVAAARFGARTLLVESFACLGGNMGPGLFAGGSLHLALHNPEAFPRGLGGIPAEFNRRVVEGEDRRVGSDYFRDSAAVAAVAQRMLEEAGAQVLLSAVVCDVILPGGAVRGVFVETKSGTLAVRSRAVIDCTGTADVADRAGAGVVELPENPSMGIHFALACVDWAAYQQALAARGPLSPEDQAWVDSHAPGSTAFLPWARQAWEAGEFRIVDSVLGFATLEVTLKAPSGDPPLAHCRTRVNGRFHPGDALALSRIQQAMYPWVHDFARFVRARVPGFERSYLHTVSPYFHARGGKSLDSVYVVTHADVERGARFDDVVFLFYNDKRPGCCDIPYRMLLPRTVDGLLAAGRSAVRRGPQIRQRHSLQLMGQAAGVAAALAVEQGVEPRQVDVHRLQRALHALGCELGGEERLRQLGIGD
ncbi:MAG: FAD-dependent oxidoreductase [Candidatus Latescibacterota bacterium]